jgi:hypothetical protein
MGEIISFIIFIILSIMAVLWLRVLLIAYELTENSLKIRFLGLPLCKLPYKEIRSCEVVKAAKLWRPAVVFSDHWWLHTRLFVDGIIIQSKWRKYVLTPENPQEFCSLITHHQQQQNVTQCSESK